MAQYFLKKPEHIAVFMFHNAALAPFRPTSMTHGSANNSIIIFTGFLSTL
jgi:hypothetical protein